MELGNNTSKPPFRSPVNEAVINNPKTTGSHSHLAELTGKNIGFSNLKKGAALYAMRARLSNRINQIW
jgi:hypothetical protein